VTRKPKNNSQVAVALHYESGMSAPIVSAKGEKELVAQMRKIARRYGIAEVRSSELAAQLAKLAEHDLIPKSLYGEVAKLFAKKGSGRKK